MKRYKDTLNRRGNDDANVRSNCDMSGRDAFMDWFFYDLIDYICKRLHGSLFFMKIICINLKEKNQQYFFS